VNVYHVVYLNTVLENASVIVVASTPSNAWAAAQAADPSASQLVDSALMNANVIVGS